MKTNIIFFTVVFASVAFSFNLAIKRIIPIQPPKYVVFRIDEVLNGKDQNLIALLNKVRGSIGTRGPASKTIWSRKNDYSIGLYISANHVYGVSGWNSRNAEFYNLFSENPGIFRSSQIPPFNGNIVLGKTLIADFPFNAFRYFTQCYQYNHFTFARFLPGCYRQSKN